MEKPSLPKGTRDFGPAEMGKRQFILETIRKVFQKFGFQSLETPAMENLSTLTGKYGEEGDQLLFRVTDSGDYWAKLMSKIKDALFDFLRYIIKDIFSQIQNPDDRISQQQIKEILLLHHQKEAWISSRYLSGYKKDIFQQFIQDEINYLSTEISKFLYASGLTQNNFDSEFEHHFRQFRDNDFNERVLPKALTFITSKVLNSETEKGLRYDLTVPFARFVVMNRSELTMPFRRFQIQPVWRADRPQKGRYREFFQCDADVVGTDSLVCEAEIVLMIKEIFGALGITGYAIKINHRAVLNGFAEMTGAQGKEQDLFIAIDKLGKAGDQVVKEELKSKGFSDSAVQSVFEILQWKGSNSEKQKSLNSRLSGSATGKKGIDEIEEIFRFLDASGDDGSHVELDISLARGLSYYTGAIFEVKINNVAIGSVCGGGRYDNLTQAFGSKEKLSGVGISFGIDRIYDAMEELKIFPKETVVSTTVLVAHADEAGFQHGLKVTATIRANGIAAEIYPEPSKLKKQMEYADKKNIPFVIVIGSEEITTGTLTLKNMESGDQQKLSLEKIIDQLVLKK